MVQFTEEAYGVFALTLYDGAACSSIVKRLRRTGGWLGAEVRERSEAAGYRSTSRPDVRLANVLATGRAPDVVKDFHARMNRTVKPLIEHVWGVRLTEHSGTQIIRYGPGGHYEAHADAGQDYQYRYFTVLCYLNDDYEGGGTSFPSLNHATTPRRGKAIVFPSLYFHRAEPVIRGEKYVLLSWVDGPSRIEWI